MYAPFKYCVLIATTAIEAADQSGIFNFNIYFTGKIADEEVAQMMHQNPEAPDPISGLKARTNFARPKWDTIFSDLKNRHHGQSASSIEFVLSNLASRGRRILLRSFDPFKNFVQILPTIHRW